MGVVRKDERYEENAFTKRGRGGIGRMVLRLFLKAVAVVFTVAMFGAIYSGGTAQAILDMAWKGHIGWGQAIQQAYIKSLQYGTLKLPDLVDNLLATAKDGLVFTALFNYFLPLVVLYSAYLSLTSFVVDLVDMREGEVVRFWVIMVLAVLAMGSVYGTMAVATDTATELTFNTTEIRQNIKQYGTTDPSPAVIRRSRNTTNTSIADTVEQTEPDDTSLFGTILKLP